MLEQMIAWKGKDCEVCLGMLMSIVDLECLDVACLEYESQWLTLDVGLK